MAKKTTITLETTSLLVVRASGAMRVWCNGCGMEAEMIGLERLRVGSNLDRALVDQWLNSGRLHRSESLDGSPVICLNSLLAHLGGGESAERGLAQAYKEMK